MHADKRTPRAVRQAAVAPSPAAVEETLYSKGTEPVRKAAAKLKAAAA